jgi:thioredoxin reductase
MTATNTDSATDVAIVGAGPYGLSLASFLRASSVKHRIFGTPMQSWQKHMPQGMCLKSDGYASTLYDPRQAFTLKRFCEENQLEYKHSGMPIPLETFVAYGLEFQKLMVPQLEPCDIRSVQQARGGFALETAHGERFTAKRVVLAVGIRHFTYMPPQLEGLPPEAVTHSFSYGEVAHFAGKRVLVVGAGASAVDTASSLADAGAEVHIMGRRPKIGFYVPEMDPRPLRRRVLFPRSGLGVGWEYVICVEAPLLFRGLPQRFRHRVVRRHLGPIPGWFMKDKVEGRIAMHMNAQIGEVTWDGEKVHVHYDQPHKLGQVFVADHVVAATGYKPKVGSLPFLDPALAERIQTVEDTPVLGPTFQTSVPGLHMIGLASANCFGPAQRFAVGAKFTSRFLAGYLKRQYA